jgi:hypothetical protein
MIPGLREQMASCFAMALSQPDGINVVTAILHWRSVTGRPSDYDPADESSADGATVTPGSRPFQAFFHRVDHRLSGFQRFVEVQTGDVILDYLEDLSLAGKEDLRIEVNGRMFVQKNASTGLLEAWDVEMDAGGTLKTLLLTPAP